MFGVDGRVPGRGARRAARVRRRRARLRGRVRGRALASHLHLRRGERRRGRRRGDPAAGANRAPGAGAPDRRRFPRRGRRRPRSGCSRSRSTSRGPFVFGVRGFRVSPGHFAERFALIVIIALGESIVAIAAGLEGELDAGVIVAALLGLVVACALWWAYFDVVALVAERRFRDARGRTSAALIARDSYSYLHLPMIAGIVLLALAVKKTIEHVDEPLKTIPAVALFGGHSALLRRARGLPPPQRRLDQPAPHGAPARLPRADPARDRGRRRRRARRRGPRGLRRDRVGDDHATPRPAAASAASTRTSGG